MQAGRVCPSFVRREVGPAGSTARENPLVTGGRWSRESSHARQWLEQEIAWHTGQQESKSSRCDGTATDVLRGL